MKTNKSIQGFFYFFTLLSLTISLNSCSSDDGNTSNTFLEIYDGTKWILSDDETLYVRLNSDLNKLIEEWEFDESHNCYKYDDSFEDWPYEIIENSKDKFVIKYSNEGNSKTLTLTVQGEVLKAVVNHSGEENGIDTYYFDRTSINVDDLEICT